MNVKAGRNYQRLLLVLVSRRQLWTFRFSVENAGFADYVLESGHRSGTRRVGFLSSLRFVWVDCARVSLEPEH